MQTDIRNPMLQGNGRFKWLIAKLTIRGQTSEESVMRYNDLLKIIKYHREWSDLVAPMFQVVPGEIEDWEKISI